MHSMTCKPQPTSFRLNESFLDLNILLHLNPLKSSPFDLKYAHSSQSYSNHVILLSNVHLNYKSTHRSQFVIKCVLVP